MIRSVACFALALVVLPSLRLAPHVSPPVAIATMQSAALDPDGDNQPALQAFLDSLPTGATVNLPAGVWPLHRRLTINKPLTVQSADPAHQATLRGVGGDGDRHVLEVGDYDANVFVNGVALLDLVVECAVTGTGIHNCVVAHGDDFTAQRCTFRGATHEGVVVHGDCLNAALTDCQAIGCGLGNASYSLYTAGFNAHAHPTRYTRCLADGCGQGFEIDGHGSVADDCDVKNQPASGGPRIAFNIGSTGLGVYDVTIKHSRTFGWDDCVIVGNGIGRLAKVTIADNEFHDGAITFQGGVATNSNAIDRIPPGPDTLGSTISGNLFILTKGNFGTVGYNTGPSAGGAVLGREPLTVAWNTLFGVGAGASQSAPLLFVAGNVAAAVAWTDNRLLGFDVASGRGDLATFTLIDNPAVPGMPTLSTARNVVVKADGTTRPPVVKIEGAP